MSKAGSKPSTTPKKKTNRDKVNEEIIKIKRKGGGSKLPIILAVVGVVLLLIVGGLIFMLSGDNKPSPIASSPGRPSGQQPGGPVGPIGETPAGPVLDEGVRNRLMDFLGRLETDNQRDGAIQELTDRIRNGGELQIKFLVLELESRAKRGVAAARDLLREAARMNENPLAQNLSRAALDRLGDSVAMAGDAGDHPTNLLPVDTQVLLNLSVKKLLASGYERGLFTFGAFRFNDFETRLGLTLGNIDRIAVGANKEHGHILGIVRTIEPLDSAWDEVKTRLAIDSQELKTSRGRVYYHGKVDFLSEFLGESMPAILALKNQAAIYRMNDYTLVFGDEETVKDLIDNPPPPPPSEKKREVAQGGAAGAAPASGAQQPPDYGRPVNPGGGGPMTRPLDVPPGVLPGSGPPPGDSGAGQASGSGAGQGGTPALGGSGSQGGAQAASANQARTYRRIDPRLRQVIEAAEEGAEALAVFADSAVPGRMGKKKSPAAALMILREMPAQQIDLVEMLAVVLPPLESRNAAPTLRAALLCRDRRDSDAVRREVEKALTVARDRLKEIFGFDFAINEAQQASSSTPGAGAMQPGGQFTPPPGGQMPGGASTGSGSGTVGASVPTPGGGNMPPPPGGSPYAPGGPVADKPVEVDRTTKGKVEVSRADELVLITIIIHNKQEDFFEAKIGHIMVRMRGEGEIAAGKVRVGDLAQGYDLMRNSLSASGEPFIAPPGIAKRAPSPTRGARPYPPSECVSWMPALLNYLPGDRYQNLANEIEYNASWRDPKNVSVGRIIVSPFLNPSGPGAKTSVRVRGADQPLAVTDFVGMAGVGPDAPYYDISDRRAGVFGYYRQTKAEDIKDGASNTILMIQSDSSVTGPWIAGGGSTVRGTSEHGDRDLGVPGGFNSPNYKGKPGVWVIMADGSARFFTKDMSPAVFRALCTINGGDDGGDVDVNGPKQKLEVTPLTPGQAQGATKQPTAPTRPRSTIKDDD